MPHRTKHIFGDDSISNNVALFGVFAVDDNATNYAEDVLARIKTKHRGKPGYPLHARELFHRHARSKTPWKNLGERQVADLYRDICHAFADVRFYRGVAFADTSKLPRVHPAHGDFPEIRFEPKSYVAMCARVVLIPFQEAKVPLRFWVDPDDTVIEWLGRKRRAKNAVEGFGLDTAAPIKPEAISGAKPPLLEVADAVAYVSARAISRQASADKPLFRELYSALRPHVSEFGYPT